MRTWVVITVSGALAAAPACGSDEGSGGGGAGGATASSVASSSTGVVEDCTPQNQCEICGAMACAKQKQKCCDTPGCATLIACGREKNCNGIDCYKAETCMDVIEAHGGPLGDAAAAAQPLGACAAENCPECPQPSGAGGAGGAGGT